MVAHGGRSPTMSKWCLWPWPRKWCQSSAVTKFQLIYAWPHQFGGLLVILNQHLCDKLTVWVGPIEPPNTALVVFFIGIPLRRQNSYTFSLFVRCCVDRHPKRKYYAWLAVVPVTCARRPSLWSWSSSGMALNLSLPTNSIITSAMSYQPAA